MSQGRKPTFEEVMARLAVRQEATEILKAELLSMDTEVNELLVLIQDALDVRQQTLIAEHKPPIISMAVAAAGMMMLFSSIKAITSDVAEEDRDEQFQMLRDAFCTLLITIDPNAERHHGN